MSNKRDSQDGISRRTFIQTSTAVGAGALLAPKLALGEAPAPQVPQRVLGKTGAKIPILLMGAGMTLDEKFDPRFFECLRYGVNYVDTADCYAGGTSEIATGNFVKKVGDRKKVWITTKSDEKDAKGMLDTYATSLKKMNVSYADMLYLHNLKDWDDINPELARAVEKLKKEGKLKFFGFSCHSGNVAELLTKAGGVSWIDSTMFRYNFRQYGNKELNKAIDAAAKANIGLIAMKTQGSEASFRDKWEKFEKTGKWNKHQAVLKAVWEDDRITAAVSHMDTLEKIRENVGAAVDKTKLGAADRKSLFEYAHATRSGACDGCDQICNPTVNAPVRIGDTMRYLMYHDSYASPEKRAEARQLFAQLPAEARQLQGVDFTPATRACPHGVDVAAHMKRAQEVLA